MTKYSLECYMPDRTEPLIMTLKNNTLSLIDGLTRTCSNMDDLKKTFSLAFPKIRPFDIMQGECFLKQYNDDGTEETLPIIFQNECRELNHIEVEEGTDKVKSNTYLQFFAASLPMRIDDEFKEYLLKNNYIDNNLLNKMDAYHEINPGLHKADKTSKRTELEECMEDYYKLRHLVIGINNYLNLQTNEFDEEAGSKKI